MLHFCNSLGIKMLLCQMQNPEFPKGSPIVKDVIFSLKKPATGDMIVLLCGYTEEELGTPINDLAKFIDFY